MSALILTTPPIPGTPTIIGRKYGSYRYYKIDKNKKF